MAKRCSKCNITKKNKDFYKRSDKSHLLQSHCILCIKIHRKEYRLQNIEKFKIRDAVYCKRNKEKISNKRRQWMNMKRKTDIHFCMRYRLSDRIRKALTKNYKFSSSEKLLGCSILEFKNYFASKFINGMNWDKFLKGEIHIDHITPCANFDLSKQEDQFRCFNYTNLQPLFAKDNLLKRDKSEVCHR